MHLATAFILGIVGGLHCAGMCGPLMLALPVVGRTRARFVAGRLAYQSGRIGVYAGLGALFGTLGHTLMLAGVQRWVSLALGFVILAGLLVSPRLLQFPLLVTGVGRLKRLMAGYLNRRTLPAMTVLGALNGLLPCGLVYAACAAAAASEGTLAGATYLFVFGLGTTPMMLGISLSGRVVPVAVRLRLRHLAPVSMGLVAGLLVLRGLGLGIPLVSPDLSRSDSCCLPGSHSQSTTHVTP
ncbi:MAG: sulfite exporter TauE/SafE family protein [Limisphaerales bacterium]